MHSILGIIVVALLLSQIIGWEMVISVLFFGGVMFAIKTIILMITPIPIGILMALGVVAFISLLFIARHLAQAYAEKKHPPDAYFHKIRAEMARTVC